MKTHYSELTKTRDRFGSLYGSPVCGMQYAKTILKTNNIEVVNCKNCLKIKNK